MSKLVFLSLSSFWLCLKGETKKKGKKMGVASLVLGIFSLVIAWIPCFSFWSIITAVTGLVLGLVGRAKAKKAGLPTGKATAGFVCCLIATIISVIWIVFIGAAASELEAAAAELEAAANAL